MAALRPLMMCALPVLALPFGRTLPMARVWLPLPQWPFRAGRRRKKQRPLGVLLVFRFSRLMAPPPLRARVVGDNLGVIRYGAGSSRFKRRSLFAAVEAGISAAVCSGWALHWQAVRRRLNEAADALATCGRAWADELRRLGSLWTVSRVQVRQAQGG